MSKPLKYSDYCSAICISVNSRLDIKIIQTISFYPRSYALLSTVDGKIIQIITFLLRPFGLLYCIYSLPCQIYCILWVKSHVLCECVCVWMNVALIGKCKSRSVMILNDKKKSKTNKYCFTRFGLKLHRGLHDCHRYCRGLYIINARVEIRANSPKTVQNNGQNNTRKK